MNWTQPWSLTRLSDLAPDDLAGVPHALALVRLGLAELADVRGRLADQLLVDPRHREPRGCLDGEGDAGGRLDDDRGTEAERELPVRAAERNAVSHADDLQSLLVSSGHPGDEVLHQRAGQAVHGLTAAVVVRTAQLQRAVVHPVDRDRVDER